MFKHLAGLFILLAAPAMADLRIVAFGDMPYGDPEDSYPRLQTLISEINDAKPDLVIHVGDILGRLDEDKRSNPTCDLEFIVAQRAFMDTIKAPVIYTPGDNEWTDCYRDNLGGHRPSERLRQIRKIFFDNPQQSLGAAPVAVVAQQKAGFPENVVLKMDEIVIFTLHVVGSKDGRNLNGGVKKEEHEARRQANLEWIGKSFAAAKDAKAVVVALHADIFEKNDFKRNEQKWKKDSAYKQIGQSLEQAAEAFGKPVLLLYGDGHDYYESRPLSESLPHLLAIEVYGKREMHAVQVTISDTPTKFHIDKITNPKSPR